MEIYNLFSKGERKIRDDEAASDAPSDTSLDDLKSSVESGQKRLKELSVDDIIGLLGAISDYWSKPGSDISSLITDLGIGFLPFWMRESNLKEICNVSTGGRRKVLDEFTCLTEEGNQKIRAQPRGLVIHWLAGNVPALGIISLVQSLLGKNGNILKVSSSHPTVIPKLLESASKVTWTNEKGKQISGRAITDAVGVIYIDRNDQKAARELSRAADVRVAWGGREAVESIMNLPRRFGTEDVIFGPRVSLAAVGKGMLEEANEVKDLAGRLARDASAFDQQGCNSPHNVFVERGGEVAPKEFAHLLSDAMEDQARHQPLREIAPADTVRILGVRAEYAMQGEAHHSDGMGWTVVYGEQGEGLTEPCYGRTLFIHPVDDLIQVAEYCSLKTQTVGLAVSSDRRMTLANAFTEKGVDRCPEVGTMSLYDSPWDGLFPISRMVRWVTA